MNVEKVCRYTIAGLFGLVGFSIAYVALGWLLQPIQDWLHQKLIKGLSK